MDKHTAQYITGPEFINTNIVSDSVVDHMHCRAQGQHPVLEVRVANIERHTHKTRHMLAHMLLDCHTQSSDSLAASSRTQGRAYIAVIIRQQGCCVDKQS